MDFEKFRLEMAHFEDGDKYRDKGDIARAIQEWQAVVELNPDNKEAHDRLGRAFQQQGNGVLAEKEFREILRIDPNDANAHYSLSSLFEERNDLSNAAAERIEAMRLDPSEEAHYELARLFIKQGDLVQARNELAKITSVDDDILDMWAELAKAADKQGDRQIAIEANQRKMQASQIWKRLSLNRKIASILGAAGLVLYLLLQFGRIAGVQFDLSVILGLGVFTFLLFYLPRSNRVVNWLGRFFQRERGE